MKLFILLLILLLGVWLWSRGRRQSSAPPPRPAKKKDAKPIDMVACAVCGVHLPRSDALPGPQGHYCGAPHRQQAER